MRLTEYRPRSELEKTEKGRTIIATMVPADAVGSYMVDLNGDGIYESMFSSLAVDMNEENSLIRILELKLNSHVDGEGALR